MSEVILPHCQCENCQLRDLFFKHLDKGEVTRICTIRKERSFTEGSTIIIQGETIKEFVYLKDGLVKLVHQNSDGSQQLITVARPLDFVSVMSVFSSVTYNYSVVAIVPSVVCVIDMQLIKSFGKTNAKFTFDLLQRMSLTNDNILLESLELKRLQVKGKVAFLLIRFADYIIQKDEFELPLSRKELAEYAGVSTENIIRALSEFRKEKIISISGKTIEIRDKERLAMIARLG